MQFKNIPGILPALKNSELSNSKIWRMNIEKITKYQLNIISSNAKLKDQNTTIDQELRYAIEKINDAVYQGIIKPTKITQFKSASAEFITTTSLIRGLLKLNEIQRKALLFALEVEMPLKDVVALKRLEAERYFNKSSLASEILHSSVISLKTKLVFWVQNQEKEHVGLVELEEAVYEAFECTYELLTQKYQNIIYDEWFQYLAC